MKINRKYTLFDNTRFLNLLFCHFSEPYFWAKYIINSTNTRNG